MGLVINSNDPRRMCCGERPGDCRCHSTPSPGVNAQPRHPHTGQYQGKTDIAAQRGASPDLEDDDLDAAGADQDEAEADEGDEDEDINTPNPSCCSPGGLCPDCQALKEYLSRDRSERSNNKRRKEVDEEDEDEEDDEDEQTNNARHRRATMNQRDDDILYPPQTTRSILAANAKAEGSNADLIGTDDSEYGYSRPGLGRDSNYDADQRTVHSVSEVFGYPAGAGENLFGASMSPEDVSRANAARAGFTHYDHEQDEEGGEIGQGDRPATPLDRSKIGTKTDYPGRPRSRDLAGSRVANSLALDAPLPPTTAELVALNQQERRQQRRVLNRRTGRMVNNSSAPGDSWDLPSPEMPD
jgi:hypothetical protein